MTYVEAQARANRDTRTLGSTALAQAKRRPRQTGVLDARGSMSRLKMAGVALAMGALVDLGADDSNVGVLLPPGQAGTLANLMLALYGHTSVNLNHTAGPAQLARMLRLARVKTVISSSEYLSRIGDLELPARVVYVEELVAHLSKTRVLRHMARVMLLPPSWIDRGRPEQVAAIVFSSGSEAEPKGVQLSHQQMLANTDATMLQLELRPGEEVLASPLPLFHAFGLGPGLWLCLANAFTIVGQADPRDGAALGELAHKSGATFLIGTPTFMRSYMRRIEPEQLRSLRFAFVGAEHCPAELRAAFLERYDAPLLEGYGCTELSPVVAVNTIDASRDGTVGLPLPGVEVFATDPDSGAILPRDSEGVLVVRSPARMIGYIDRPDLTEKVFVHGGYDTGDIGHVDADGFVHITGRLARFAKIGGEMVPLDRVEEALQDYIDQHHPGECELAVAAVSDRRKGERLLVLHTGLDCPIDDVLTALDDYPQLHRPRSRDCYNVAEIPVLGTGKRDFGALQRLAEEIDAQQPSAVGGAVRRLVRKVRGGEGDGDGEADRGPLAAAGSGVEAEP
jgi:acyl-[acyl-carrier-protein]-phospholipid O-acyltransferase/long-chain-fatty-acid--[acyl-carrier-protein] ligase